ncbi:hypothetical protein EUTSA_v10010866mg [Eutrema salsugineum]|uniref:Uncharacterized protein n=1 Tax=Eutrema salsugineum TaxID=72664 RepID=V4LSA5_EUTSA|nr:hypothetical protein EUTSA_v10010866mg [Eutrema salsugineum]
MVAGEKRQSGQQILRLTWNHVSTQRLWNSCKQGRDLMTSSSSILIRHTLQHSSSLLPPPPCTLGARGVCVGETTTTTTKGLVTVA